MRTFPIVSVGSLSLAVLLSACASVPPPTEQLAAGRSALNSAQQAGAPQYAPVELAQARTKLQDAEAAMRAEEFEVARRLAEEASADAALAQARAGSARARQAAQQVDESIRTLRSELERSTAAAPAR